MDKARDRMRRTRLSERGTGGSKPVPSRGADGAPDQQRWMTVAWIVGGFVLILLFQSFLGPSTEEISFTRMFELADEGRITEANVSESAVGGTIKEPGEDERSFTT